MKALVTGATSGIGRDVAYLLSKRGYDLVLASRNVEKMQKLKQKLNTQVTIIACDLSNLEDCYKLYEQLKCEDIDILVNNAGFGAFGNFWNIELDTELNMLDLNVRAVHVLTKLFLNDFRKKNKGYILNVASSAAFFPGPLLGAYYAGKAYVLRLSEAIYEELRQENSNVHISVLCPGPVDTNFSKRANVKFAIPGLKSSYVAKIAISSMFKGKLIIIPGFSMKAVYVAGRVVPDKFLLKAAYYFQSKKGE